jgi:hypothetical protein
LKSVGHGARLVRVRKWSLGVGFGVAVSVALAIPASTFSARSATHGYVTSSLEIPASSAQAKAYGRDIDGDGHVDNALGQLFAALTAQNVDFQSPMDAEIQHGHILMLHSLRTPSFTKTKKATWQVLFAQATPTPDFSGGGTFTVDATAPHSRIVRATIKRHRVQTTAGAFPIRIDLLGNNLSLNLDRAEIFATCSKMGCTSGRITGAVSQHDMNTKFIPVLAGALTAIISQDCPGPGPASCTGGSTGQTLQSLFDANNDLVISTSELTQNQLIKALLAPDVALRHHGKRDGVSFGLGFTSVRAKFVR